MSKNNPILKMEPHSETHSENENMFLEKWKVINPFLGNGSSTSYIKVASDRPDEYQLTLRFKTSLSNGLIAYGSSRPDSDFFFSLGLTDGSLSLNSNMITTPVKNLGYDLNNTEWQSVYISINSSTITLGVSNR